LSSAAQEYDGSLVRSVKTAPSAARRSIYYTEFEPRKIEDEFLDVAYYDIDTSPNDKSISKALEVLDSMLTNGVVSLRKHKRNGTS
jgi:hypothetical protein